MFRPRTAALATTGAVLLPLTALALPASAQQATADPPPPQSIAAFCEAVPPDFQPFTDIAGNTHEQAIECAAYAEIALGGPGSLPPEQYGPDLTVRRDQMASFIVRMMDTAEQLDTGDGIQSLPPSDGTNEFNDVSSANVHSEAIDRLSDAGIVRGGPRGLGQDQYGPSLPTDRAQMASFINRAIGYLAGSELGTQNDYFTDDEESVHEQNINGVASAGIAVGNGTDLYFPRQDVPRDQMASFLIRSLAQLHEDGLIADVGALNTSVVVLDQRDQEVSPGSTITGTVYGADNATSVTVEGECVVGGELTDADTATEGLQFEVGIRSDAAAGNCPVIFTTTFPDGSTDTDVVDVTVAGETTNTGQTFIVAPQQPRTTSAGEPVEFSVIGRYDDQQFTGPVDLTLFPCENVDATGSGPVTFTDADSDGFADGIASTDSGDAYFSTVEGVETGGPERYLPDQGPGDDDVLDFTVVSDAPDCAIVTAIAPDDDQQLSVDAQGQPTEPFGVGKVTWE